MTYFRWEKEIFQFYKLGDALMFCLLKTVAPSSAIRYKLFIKNDKLKLTKTIASTFIIIFMLYTTYKLIITLKQPRNHFNSFIISLIITVSNFIVVIALISSFT